MVFYCFACVQTTQNLFWPELEVNGRLYRIPAKAFRDGLQFGKHHSPWNRGAALATGVQKVIEFKRARGLYPRAIRNTKKP